ncbi:putative meiotic recombination protein ski8 [Golovinomyces cichoracearum]|uniref:Large ribosomal subunit protein bL32m n=1 Tax=Golovinomyces cichoracearum TaxID=62708 RepID=A0A420ID56_9PEZI|nr:putative meiotic recombination protein ski8 [Golovinomyces cichoracearum]
MASIHVTTSSLISFFLPKQLSVWNRTAFFATRQHQRITNSPCLSQASHLLLAFSYPLLIPPAISINVPDWIGNLWESVLRAVPKKKTSHSKKRSRQRAGKALKDVTSLNKCSGCGHYLMLRNAHDFVYCRYTKFVEGETAEDYNCQKAYRSVNRTMVDGVTLSSLGNSEWSWKRKKKPRSMALNGI